jgi:hypothetical protein
MVLRGPLITKMCHPWCFGFGPFTCLKNANCFLHSKCKPRELQQPCNCMFLPFCYCNYNVIIQYI